MEEEVKSNFDAVVKPPRKKHVRKNVEVKESPGRPPKYAPTYSVKFAAYPIGGSKVKPEAMLKAFNVIERNIMTVTTPPRVFGNKNVKTDSGAKIIAQRTSQEIVFRESPDDELFNALDFIANSSMDCEVYIIISKKNYAGVAHTALIFKGIDLVSMEPTTEISINQTFRSKYSYINVKVNVGIVYEITTADVGDVKTYLSEKFGV